MYVLNKIRTTFQKEFIRDVFVQAMVVFLDSLSILVEIVIAAYSVCC